MRRASLWSLHPDYAESEPEPSAHHYECARIELGCWASDEQVTARAMEIADDETRLWNELADADQAESRLDDRNAEGDY